MAIKKINDATLTAIANAIRAKNGTTTTYKPSQMASAISSIQGGGNSGVNIDIYDPVLHPVEQGNIQSASASDFSSTTRLRVKGYVEVKPNTAYRISTNLYKLFLIQCYADKTPIGNSGWQTSPYLFNSDPSCAYIRLTFQNSSGSTITVDEFEWLKIEQLEGGGGSEDLNDVLTEQETLIAQLQAILDKKAKGDTEEVEDAFIARTFSGDYENDRVASIGYGCFHSCTNLTSVSFPNVTELKDYTFYGCSKLTRASLPNVTGVGGHVFNLCSSLTTISLPLIKSAGTYAFSSTKISVIDFPLLETMGAYTFGNIKASCTVNLPKLATTANSGFRNSKGITKVDLAIATKVDNLSFYYCNNLETLILRKTDAICTLSNTNAFTGTKIANGTGYIYVPSALVDTYKAATNWSSFASQIKAIEGSEYE